MIGFEPAGRDEPCPYILPALMDSRPIGIFDSGVGGLTVLAALRRRLPGESIVYLGDTARVPYGTKSRATIERYALEDSAFLVKQGVKMLVIACNTASAMARERLRSSFRLPILSVVGPGARSAARATRSGRIGVIATEATIESGAYTSAIREACADAGEIEIFTAACPLFVPLAEEGETESEVARIVAEKYLAPLREKRIDTLLLGCTHYPLLGRVISETISRDGESVTLVDSAEATAEETAALLFERGLLGNGGNGGNGGNQGNEDNEDNEDNEGNEGSRGGERFYVTDAARRFHRLAERILGRPLEHLEAVELPAYTEADTERASEQDHDRSYARS